MHVTRVTLGSAPQVLSSRAYISQYSRSNSRLLLLTVATPRKKWGRLPPHSGSCSRVTVTQVSWASGCSVSRPTTLLVSPAAPGTAAERGSRECKQTLQQRRSIHQSTGVRF
jgi:hypothetical protein